MNPLFLNPREGELFVDAQRRYGRVVQMGTQQRSAPESIDAIRRSWQRTAGSFACDPSTGHIVGDTAATKLWSREYEPGWEPRV